MSTISFDVPKEQIDRRITDDGRPSFVFDGQKECPHCHKKIGFVNFRVHEKRVDTCPKCKQLIEYKLNIN